MITIITTVLGFIFKGLQLAAKIALNRSVVIVTFVGTILITIGSIYSSLTDTQSVLSQAIAKVHSVNVGVSNFLQSMQYTEYFQAIGYALSLDTLLDGIIVTLVFAVCTLGSAAFTALVGVFFSVLPCFSDLALSALKHQAASAISGISK